MNKIYILLATILTLSFVGCQNNSTNQTSNSSNSETAVSNSRIVSLSGGITEVLCALGLEKQIVGVDVTSIYPASVTNTAQTLGHIKSIGIEQIMATNPTLVLAYEKEINPELKQKLIEAGIKVELLKHDFTIAGTKELIQNIARLEGIAQYDQLGKKIDEDLSQIQALPKPLKVLFIYARGHNMTVAGRQTPMANLIQIAGAENAANGFEDFKPLTPEALVADNPDVLLFFDSGLESSGGVEAVLQVPGVAQTKAGQNKAIISLESSLMNSFGPRVGEAALALNKKLLDLAK
jgi:iron complex transport system substrate-binding protein